MSDAAPQRVPAVVVGAGINGLGVLRSLAQAKVPVIVLDSDAQRSAMRSRYGRKKTFTNDKADAVVDALEALANVLDGERPVLFLTQEDTVYSVSAHRQRLQPLYRFSLPPHDRLTAIMHKDGFRAAAQKAGAVIPRTLHVTQAGQLEMLNTLTPPLVVKPSVRDADYAATFSKAYWAESVDEALDLVRCILPVLPDIVIQEWIEGDDSDIYFCLQYISATGGTAASFVGRKIRSWPPRVGGTASCAPASSGEARLLTERTADFFHHAGMRGMAGMEYKHDTGSGEFFMVEPTLGRTDYQEEVATLNGVNIPLSAYCAELGLPQPGPTMPGTPRIWRDRMADRQAANQENRGLPWQPAGARVVDSLWRMSDPMPAVASFAERLGKRVLRTISHTRSVRSEDRAAP